MKEEIAVNQNNYVFFKAHLNELLKKYSDKYLVIKDETVIGAYKSFDEAYRATENKETPGTFIIQQCIKEDANTASYMSNNVKFA